MLEQILTTGLCSDIIQMLLKRRQWTISRIARVTRRPVEYIRRIESRRQSFQMSDVEAIAKACKVKPYKLVFEAFRREDFEPGLYALGLQEIERQEELERALARKPAKKRRTSKKAA